MGESHTPSSRTEWLWITNQLMFSPIPSGRPTLDQCPQSKVCAGCPIIPFRWCREFTSAAIYPVRSGGISWRIGRSSPGLYRNWSPLLNWVRYGARESVMSMAMILPVCPDSGARKERRTKTWSPTENGVRGCNAVLRKRHVRNNCDTCSVETWNRQATRNPLLFNGCEWDISRTASIPSFVGLGVNRNRRGNSHLCEATPNSHLPRACLS